MPLLFGEDEEDEEEGVNNIALIIMVYGTLLINLKIKLILRFFNNVVFL